MAHLSRLEQKYYEQDATFKLERINDEYIKQIKGKAHEHLYVE